MSSTALTQWETTRSEALDEIERAHRALAGPGPGRRYATLQLNHAYSVLLSSQFQGFCRDLHSEAADFIAANTAPPTVARALRALMLQGRKLDAGNPNPGNIGSDFARLGMDLWLEVDQVDGRRAARHRALGELNVWRNAIAHQDWSKVPERRPDLRLKAVQLWRSACDGLARSFDRAASRYLTGMVGRSPW